MVVEEILWISLSKQAGQSSMELNSIRLDASWLQFAQLVPIVKICQRKLVFVNCDVVGLKCAQTGHRAFDVLSVRSAYRLVRILSGALGSMNENVAVCPLSSHQGRCDGRHRRNLLPILPAQVLISDTLGIGAQAIADSIGRSRHNCCAVPLNQLPELGADFSVAATALSQSR